MVLLKEIYGLRHNAFLRVSLFIGLALILISPPNFFHLAINSSNYEIIKFSNRYLVKLIVWVLAARIPVMFLQWILNSSRNKATENTNKPVGGYSGWQPYSGFRSMNKPVINGVASLNINKNFIWAFLLLLLGGNWISHHLVLCLSLLCGIVIFKVIKLFLKNFKTC
jgi:hypothetical protein